MVKRHDMAGDAEPARLKGNLSEAISAVREQTQSSSKAQYVIKVDDLDGELQGFSHYSHAGEPKVKRTNSKGDL